jgi:4-amino-4-deoxy-L-arabinose transferase-like glycosyltransferase
MFAERRLFRWRFGAAAGGVLILSAALFFTRLGKRSLWSEEVRWAEIPREMLRAGDFWWPTFNGRVYYDKPLGSYWFVLAAAKITGGPDEWAARLPSAISGLAAVTLMMLIGRRLYGPRVGVLAGAVLATSFGFTGFARTAAADAENVAGILAALWLFVRNDGRPGRWLYLFWLAMALTSLTKGLLGFALPLLVAGVYSTWSGLAEGDSTAGRIARAIAANRWFLNRTTLLAAPLAISLYLAPFLMSHHSGGALEGLAMVYRENVRRFFNPVNHRGPIYLYAYVIFALLAPWSVLLPAALIGGRLTGGNITSAANRFSLSYFWATFLFFTLSSSRRSYYLLPILPAAALLVANVLATRKPERPEDDDSEHRPSGRSRSRLAGVIVFVTCVLLAPVALLPPSLRLAPFDRLPELPAPGAFVAAWGVSIIAIAVSASRQCRTAAGLVAAFAFQAYLFLFALPAADDYRTQRPFAAAVRDRLGADLPGLALYRTSDIVYYLDPPSPLCELHESAAARRAADGGIARWLIVRRRDRDALGGDWSDELNESSRPWESEEQVKSKLLLLRWSR